MNPVKRTCVGWLLFIILFFVTPVWGQVHTARFNTLINNNVKGFYEYLPKGYESGTDSFPLLVFLHGMGERGNGDSSSLPLVLKHGPPKLINEGRFPTSFTVSGSTYKFIILTPQFAGWPSANDVEAIIKYALKNYRVDPSRVYLTGISMGGGGVWDYAGESSLFANRLAAIVPISGASYPEPAKAKVIARAKLPVWATHNSGDDVVPLYKTTGYVDAINRLTAPGAAKKTLFNAAGHNSWSKTYNPAYRENDLNVYEWMLQFKRSTLTAGSNSPVCPNSILRLSANKVEGASYRWTGPNGFVSTLREPAVFGVTSAAAGTYTVTLTIGDSVATAKTAVVVTAPATFYRDRDQDGYGDTLLSIEACRAPKGYTARSGDFDDKRPSIYPGALEIMDGLDNDCDGLIDEKAVRLVKVNLFDGASPYYHAEWNNWNLSDSLASPALKYTNARLSKVKVALSASIAVKDYGTSYGGTMAPPEVLRHASTGDTIRTLTFSGLAASSTYYLELYASTNSSGNATHFTINGTSASIATDTNQVTKASFAKLIPTSGQVVVHIASTDGYNCLNGFVLTERPNKKPVVDAGADTTLESDVTSIALSGKAKDEDGTIVSYKWVQVSGPSAAAFNAATAASTTVSALKQGTYVFRLTAKDNKGDAGGDFVNVVVDTLAVVPTKYIKVNLFGGINPYTNAEWNNWNVNASLNSGVLTYSDATASTIHAIITKSAIADNGADYGGTMAPAEVLRYTSGATEERTLTLSGLSTYKTYSLELYASRDNEGNATLFTLNNTTITIETDSNTTAKAKFTNLKASADGQLVLGIKSLDNYNYLNGFVLSESSATTTKTMTQIRGSQQEQGDINALQVQAFPNPSQHYFTLQIRSNSAKAIQLCIVDVLGRVIDTKQGITTNSTLSIGHLYRPGVYYAEVLQDGRKATVKLVKTAP